MSFNYNRSSASKDSRSISSPTMSAAYARVQEEVVELREQATPIGAIPGEKLAEHLYNPGVAASLRADTRHTLLVTAVVASGIWIFLLLTIGLYSLITWNLLPVAIIFWIGVISLPVALFYQVTALIAPSTILNRSWIAHRIAEAGHDYATARVARIETETLSRKVEITRHQAALNAQQQLLSKQIAVQVFDSKLEIFMQEIAEQVQEKLDAHLQAIAPAPDPEAWIDTTLRPISQGWREKRFGTAEEPAGTPASTLAPTSGTATDTAGKVARPSPKREISDQEHTQIENLLAEGLSNRAILEKMGKGGSYNAVIKKVREERVS